MGFPQVGLRVDRVFMHAPYVRELVRDGWYTQVKELVKQNCPPFF